jgi:hypothetical protein
MLAVRFRLAEVGTMPHNTELDTDWHLEWDFMVQFLCSIRSKERPLPAISIENLR